MVKVQLDLTKKEDKIVKLYKAVNGFNSKGEAIKSMIKYFETDVSIGTFRKGV